MDIQANHEGSPDTMKLAEAWASAGQKELAAAFGARLSWYWSAVAVLVLCYLLQLFSPLRLNYDTVVLLSVAESASEGQGYLDRGHPTVYPPGYPALVAMLRKADIATPATLVGLNLFFLAAGLLSSSYVLSRCLRRTRAEILSTSILCLLSFAVLKHATLAMTDVPFFGIEATCLAAMVSASGANAGRGFRTRVCAAAILLFSALAIRRTGVALLLPFFLMLLTSGEGRMRFQSHRAAILATCALVMFGGLGIVVKTFTLHDFGVIAKTYGLLRLPGEIVSYRLAELGVIATNLPVGKIGHIQAALPLGIGALVLLCTIRGLLKQRDGLMGIFMVSYIAVLFCWPYQDVRFWLPVLPFLLTYFFAGTAFLVGGSYIPWYRTLTVYRTVFVVLGVFALGGLTRITFSGNNFGARYAQGSYWASYCAAWKNCDGRYDPEQVDAEAVHILEIYR